MSYLIRLEEEKDYDEVINVTRESFWNVYKPGCDEHLMVRQIHDSPAYVKELSSVACDGDKLMGSIVYTLGRVARDLGFRAIVIYGNPDYYGRFGYANSEKYAITTPDGTNFDAFMVLELEEGRLRGVNGKFYYDKAFEIDKNELTEFEKRFPYKEKAEVNKIGINDRRGAE